MLPLDSTWTRAPSQKHASNLDLALRQLEGRWFMRYGDTFAVKAVAAIRRGLFPERHRGPGRDDREGGELVTVGAPRGPKPLREGAEAKPPARTGTTGLKLKKRTK